jgi:hypothetical protein
VGVAVPTGLALLPALREGIPLPVARAGLPLLVVEGVVDTVEVAEALTFVTEGVKVAEALRLGVRLTVLEGLCEPLPVVEPLALHRKERVEVGVVAPERLAPGAA